MSAAREDISARLSELAWNRLQSLETLHGQIQLQHERVIRSLDTVAQYPDDRELMIAWNRYRAVDADLSEITEEIGSLRLITT